MCHCIGCLLEGSWEELNFRHCYSIFSGSKGTGTSPTLCPAGSSNICTVCGDLEADEYPGCSMQSCISVRTAFCCFLHVVEASSLGWVATDMSLVIRVQKQAEVQTMLVSLRVLEQHLVACRGQLVSWKSVSPCMTSICFTASRYDADLPAPTAFHLTELNSTGLLADARQVVVWESVRRGQICVNLTITASSSYQGSEFISFGLSPLESREFGFVAGEPQSKPGY